MDATEPTPAGAALSAASLNLFRATSLMLAAGDRLVAQLGLTSARWQILGAITAAQRPEPVAWLARDMGANRQNVQRIVNDLNAEGLVEFAANPHHRRAQFVVLTQKGRQAFEAAMRLATPWLNALADGLSADDVAVFHRVLATLRRNLEAEGEASRLDATQSLD
jgi:DNA-binding MarR family transcriptional regulator